MKAFTIASMAVLMLWTEVAVGTGGGSGSSSTSDTITVDCGDDSSKLLFYLEKTRNCCTTTGQCGDSSCVVFGFPNSAGGTCQTNKNSNCPGSYCAYTGTPACTPSSATGKRPHCYGKVRCTDGGSSCPGHDEICLENGVSDQFKVCSATFKPSGNPGCPTCNELYRTDKCTDLEDAYSGSLSIDLPGVGSLAALEELQKATGGKCRKAPDCEETIICDAYVPPEAFSGLTSCTEPKLLGDETRSNAPDTFVPKPVF